MYLEIKELFWFLRIKIRRYQEGFVAKLDKADFGLLVRNVRKPAYGKNYSYKEIIQHNL